MKPKPITAVVGTALWRGFEGTPADFAKTCNVTKEQARSALAGLHKSREWVERKPSGRTFIYYAQVVATPVTLNDAAPWYPGESL